MDVNDEALALAAAGGDREAFAKVLELHYDRLFAICFRMMGNAADAEDLLQDICLKLPTKLRGFRGEAKLTTWLYRVAVNAAHDRRRRQQSRGKANAGWGEWEILQRADTDTSQARVAWLHRAMSKLPESLRDTLALVFDDLTHADVAKILGVSEGTVSWRISKAKERLRAAKAEEEADDERL